jgi:phosphohistidine swiveling domain-containing protein/membrane protein insertase Oxa1/YidC/SpoIIIJ
LPKRPIVVPCYDKRSSFYALILGVRLSRMGHDFRGRYTVPEEFTLPGKANAWVAQWEASRADRSLFGEARNALASLVLGLHGWFGSLALAIVAAALLLRLVLAPFAVKAERDGIVQRAAAAELTAARTRLRDDPVRLRREFGSWLRRHRITPGRNLLGSLLLLTTFTALFAAVSSVCAGSTESVGWFRLAVPDSTGLLPLAAAALLQTIVLQQSRSRTPLALGLGACFTLGITVLVWTCCAGAQLYLVASFGAVVLQSLLVRRVLQRGTTTVHTPGGIVPLAAAAGREDLGGKAIRLGDLIAAGMPVPDGFVVVDGHEPSEGELDRAWRRLGARSVAVRSSARGEDGAQRSFAGEFRTVLGVGRDGLRAAIAAVRASYQGRHGGVIVQELVPADHAGVMFTEDPAHAGRALIEMVEGLGEGLVSGTATPREFRLRRLDQQPVGPACEFDLKPLLAMGQQLERLFGSPQDIEWARVGGRFVLLQSRPVTRRAGDGNDPIAVREAERARLANLTAGVAADETVFEAGDYASLLPAPTPFSFGLLQQIWAPGGSVDLACRRLGLQYRLLDDDTPYLQSVFGRCMVDRRRARTAVRTPAAAAFRLGHAAPALERDLEQFLATFHKEVRLRAAIDLRRLGNDELLELAVATGERFVHTTYVEAEVVNLAAEAYVAAARRSLERKGLDAAALLGQGVETVVQRAFRLLAGAETVAQRGERFAAAFGHRAAHDFELAEPRFAEASEQVAAMARAAVAPRPSSAAVEPTGRLLRCQLQRARRFQELKEAAKDAAMRELALLRALLRELGDRHGLGDLVFQLTPAELAQLGDATFVAAAGKLAAERRQRGEWLRAMPLADAVTPLALATAGSESPLAALPPNGLRGARVAGDREPVGRVVVLTDVAAIGELGANDVLVVRCTDPCWLPAFGRVAGLVTEIGGWLSHAAIQAREHNLPAIVGASNATGHLRTGELVRLRRDGVVEQLGDPRSAGDARRAGEAIRFGRLNAARGLRPPLARERSEAVHQPRRAGRAQPFGVALGTDAARGDRQRHDASTSRSRDVARVVADHPGRGDTQLAQRQPHRRRVRLAGAVFRRHQHLHERRETVAGQHRFGEPPRAAGDHRQRPPPRQRLHLVDRRQRPTAVDVGEHAVEIEQQRLRCERRLQRRVQSPPLPGIAGQRDAHAVGGPHDGDAETGERVAQPRRVGQPCRHEVRGGWQRLRAQATQLVGQAFSFRRHDALRPLGPLGIAVEPQVDRRRHGARGPPVTVHRRSDNRPPRNCQIDSNCCRRVAAEHVGEGGACPCRRRTSACGNRDRGAADRRASA